MRAQKTERFDAALAELAAHAEAQGFEVRGGFYAWDRLKVLVGRLERAYDHFELEGDAEPVRDELVAYRDDLANMGLRPDGWVTARVEHLVAALEAPEIVEIRISATSPVGPGSMLAVHPDALAELMRERTRAAQPG